MQRNCTANIFNQTEPEKKLEIAEQSMQNNISFQSATDFVNQFLQLTDSFPLEDIIPDRTVKLDNHIKLTLNLNYFRNYIYKINVILGVIKEKAHSKNTFYCLIAV